MRKSTLSVLVVFMLLVLCNPGAHAQMTKIRGFVKDSLSGEPIPFANVYFEGTTIGSTTDFNGRFSLETLHAGDILTVACVGYEKQVSQVKKYRYQELTFSLLPSNVTLEEVVVVAGENPADILFRKMIENKSKNNSKDVDAWQAEIYNKIQFDANNFDQGFRDKRVFKHFEFIFDYVDTSAVNGKVYLPMFISEAVSEIYYRREPKSKMEKIVAARGSGVENQSIAQFLGNLYQEVNVYDNYITLFEKNFVSPAASFGMMYYKYFLVDSANLDGHWCYKVMYKPRRKQELTFNGFMWINDTSFAIREVELTAADDANLNFINDLTVRQQYDLFDDRYWMLTRDFMMADFNVVENTKTLPGFFGQRTTNYSKYRINKPVDPQVFKSPVNVTVDEGSMDKSEEYWLNARPEAFTKRESSIYAMIDSIENVPIYRTYVDLIYMFTNGYTPWHKLEIGPLAKLYSHNPVEGSRFRIGGRTSTAFSRNLRLSGHLAYGTLDQRFKYGGGLLYMFDKNPKRALDLNVKYDIEQLGSSFNAYSEDNILSTVFRRQPSDKLSLVNEFKLGYEHEWFTGLSNRFEIAHRELKPAGNFVLTTNGSGGELITHASVTTTELACSLRFAFRERNVIRDFDRINFGTKFPVVNLRYGYSPPGLINGEWEYHRIQASIDHWFNVGSFGWTKYIFEAGRVWGTVPFPLLVLHPGNETFIFDEYAFNLMNYYEFVSDRYASLYVTHHFDGLFFNHVPLLRQLKWREVIFVKGLAGTLSQKNRDFNNLPTITDVLDKPYIEAGLGIENIFKIVRIDGVWRLSHRDHPSINKFALFISLQFSF
ncbi:MAG: carboxypeptidase-like regulatory domain-containing protein [Bacteroidales bacterium]|nr:carboxypeptidase-like regulatory domain-containing protein [Bacteroidales bacterium]